MRLTSGEAAVCCILSLVSVSQSLNLRPIVGYQTCGVAVKFIVYSFFKSSVEGILAQETSDQTLGDYYIESSIVKYVEAAGARAVPIRIFQSEEYYQDLFGKINGVLFPGGLANIVTSGYAKAAQILFKLAIKANDEGDYFPLWGTCLGFELLTALVTGRDVLKNCHAMDNSYPLHPIEGFKSSRIFSGMPEDVFQYLTEENVTANSHIVCLTPEVYEQTKELKSFYQALSVDQDQMNMSFVSMMEAYKYPFYGTHWHPEMNLMFWTVPSRVSHTAKAVRVAQHFAEFFISEARKSNHHFPSMKEEAAALIDNYQPVFFGAPLFKSQYFFKNNTVIKHWSISKPATCARFPCGL